MPALMLSGFIFDLRNMPVAIRVVSQVLPATHFMGLIKTLFLAGDNWPMVASERFDPGALRWCPDRGVAPEPPQAAGLTAMRR